MRRILIWMQRAGLLRKAVKRVAGCKGAVGTSVPSRAQVDHPGLLQLAREAERRDRAALHRPTWIIARRREHRARAADRRPHAAERIPELPAAHAALLGEKALVTIHVGLRAVAEDLRQWGGKVLGVAGGGAPGGLRHEDAIAVVGVGRAALLDEPIEGVVIICCRAVAAQVARRVVAPAHDLIGGVVAVLLHRRPVLVHGGAVAREVVGIRIHVTGVFGSPDQALEAVVAVADGAADPLGWMRPLFCRLLVMGT